MTNRKLHMRFRLAPRPMTWMTLNCYKFEFSENVVEFRRFGRQQLLNECRWTRIVNICERLLLGFTVVSRMVTFPDGFFPGKTFPGKSFPGCSFSRIKRFPERRFPDGHFPGQTFPGWSFSRMRQFLIINLQAHTQHK